MSLELHVLTPNYSKCMPVQFSNNCHSATPVLCTKLTLFPTTRELQKKFGDVIKGAFAQLIILSDRDGEMEDFNSK